jgi:hypothetical protein
MMHYSSLLAAVLGNWNTFGRVHLAEISNCITSKNMWNFSRMGGTVGFKHGGIQECRDSCDSWHMVCGGGGTGALLLIPHTGKQILNIKSTKW